jgi:HAMP domain-containing protein
MAFHYDRENFAEGASIVSGLFVERTKAESLIIFERGSRAYFFYPEQAREIVAFEFNEGDSGDQIPLKLGQYLTEVQKLMQEVGHLRDELLDAYAEMKSLGSAIRHEAVTE